MQQEPVFDYQVDNEIGMSIYKVKSKDFPRPGIRSQ